MKTFNLIITLHDNMHIHIPLTQGQDNTIALNHILDVAEQHIEDIEAVRVEATNQQAKTYVEHLSLLPLHKQLTCATRGVLLPIVNNLWQKINLSVSLEQKQSAVSTHS